MKTDAVKNILDVYERFSSTTLPLVVIDGCYFELYEKNQYDRFGHLKDSLCLYKELTHRGVDCIVTGLINDFCEKTYCGHYNEQQKLSSGSNDNLWSFLPNDAQELYQRFIGIDAVKQVKIFSIRTTRNRAANRIKVLSKSQDTLSPLIMNKGDGDLTDLFLDTEAGDIFIGSRNNSTSTISVRCTALMAQHYFDLFKYAKTQVKQFSDILIFDFNRILEKDRVGAGASAGFVLNTWPTMCSVKIVNLVYLPDGKVITQTTASL